MPGGTAAKRARPAALDAAATTFVVPGLGMPYGIFVLADGNRLVASSSKNTILQLAPAGWPPLLGTKTKLGAQGR